MYRLPEFSIRDFLDAKGLTGGCHRISKSDYTDHRHRPKNVGADYVTRPVDSQINPGGAHGNYRQDDSSLNSTPQQKRFYNMPNQVGQGHTYNESQKGVTAGKAEPTGIGANRVELGTRPAHQLFQAAANPANQQARYDHSYVGVAAD